MKKMAFMFIIADAKSHSIGNDMKLCDSNGYDTTNEKHSHGNYFDKEESRS